MKIETSRYILNIMESRSTFDKYTYVETLNIIKDLKKTPLVKGRLPKEAILSIRRHRQYLKTDFPRMYRISVYFKHYRAKRNFDMEFYPTKNSKFAESLKSWVNKELGKYRKQVLQVNTDQKLILKEYEIKIMGSRYGHWVYSEPGQLRTIYLKRKVKDLYTAKVPTKACRYVGLELEFCAPIVELEFALKLWEAGIHKFAQMKKDGSLRPKMGETGFELAMLFPESHYKKNLRQVCKILEEVGARADDRRCGLHVHIDMRRRKKDIVYNNLVACQDVLFSFLDPARRDNEFCRTVDSRKFPNKFNNTREERYKTINAASYYKYKTLEIRMHEGSVNCPQIMNWMALLIKISNHKSRVKSNINELTILKKRFRIDNKMSEFFQDKTCHWQLQGPQRPTGARFRSTLAAEAEAPEMSFDLETERVVPTPSTGQTVRGT